MPPAVRGVKGNGPRPKAISGCVRNGERHARPPIVTCGNMSLRPTAICVYGKRGRAGVPPAVRGVKGKGPRPKAIFGCVRQGQQTRVVLPFI